MDPRLDYIVSQYGLHTRLFRNALRDLERVKSERVKGQTNHIAWIAGHIVSARYSVAQFIGMEVQEPHPELYENGKGIDSEAEYPSLDTSLQELQKISPLLLEKLKSLTPEQLTAPGPFAMPMGNSVGELIAFFADHEAYHIGQLGILRRIFGQEAMSYD